MDNLRRLGNRISVSIPRDEDRFTGRECPECEGYFKIEGGTGLKGIGLPCHCAYCGHIAQHDQFATREQIEYVKSVAMRRVADAIFKDLKGLEFDQKPRGAFGFGISLKVKQGDPIPVRYYREAKLETEVICADCTLRYSVYGVFAYCPDCGKHNSRQILEKNFEVIGKMLALAAVSDIEMAERLVQNALEDCVSAFDGFGREVCRIFKSVAIDQSKVDKLSFQNVAAARSAVSEMFGIDLCADVTPDDWQSTLRSFQKRHLFAHKMGVVDDEYVKRSGDTQAVVGRKVALRAEEVRALVDVQRKIASSLFDRLQQSKTCANGVS